MQIANLEQDIADLKSSKKSRGKSLAADTTEITTQTEDQKIAMYGRKFGVMNDMFISRQVFMQPRTAFSPEDPARYANDENKLKGLISELWEEVPQELHSVMEGHTRFRDIVRNFIILLSPLLTKRPLYLVPQCAG